jgi:hypothetical protein
MQNSDHILEESCNHLIKKVKRTHMSPQLFIFSDQKKQMTAKFIKNVHRILLALTL